MTSLQTLIAEAFMDTLQRGSLNMFINTTMKGDVTTVDLSMAQDGAGAYGVIISDDDDWGLYHWFDSLEEAVRLYLDFINLEGGVLTWDNYTQRLKGVESIDEYGETKTGSEVKQ